MKSPKLMVLVVLAVTVLTVAYQFVGGDLQALIGGEYTYDEASDRVERLKREVDFTQRHVTRVAKVERLGKRDLGELLPDISEFPVVVDPPLGPNDVAVEIFVTTVRSGKGSDGFDVEVANAFNAANVRLASGKIGKVRIRKIASGTAYFFVASRKYLPDAFSPVHRLWIEMARAKGIELTRVRDRTVRSVGGVVMKTQMADRIRSKRGSIDVRTIINEVAQGDLAMGYTNPFASSTGLNFLVTVLHTFADGQEQQMLSPSVVSAFEQFQRGVPFVALTTLHMRDSVRNDGSLEAFILGHQTYSKTAELASGFEFFPFGVPHDHPLYAIGDLGADKLEVLERYAQLIEEPRFRTLASQYGWNQIDSHEAEVPVPSGETLILAQQLWKEKKDAGVPISAVFVADVSGSMKGSRLSALRESLLAGADFIGENNAIGLVLFSNEVTEVLPIKAFNLRQKGAFLAAVEGMRAGGGTAMYDGIVVGLSMLLEARRQRPDTKLMMFVLTDGQTRDGLAYNDILPVVRGLNIPVYTIGYEANLEVLKQLSGIVEAASLNAKEGEVGFKIGQMLNAQM